MTHSFLARLPSCRAHLPMFVCVLERLHQPQRLVYGSAYWQIIHCDLSQLALRVDDE